MLRDPVGTRNAKIRGRKNSCANRKKGSEMIRGGGRKWKGYVSKAVSYKKGGLGLGCGKGEEVPAKKRHLWGEVITWLKRGDWEIKKKGEREISKAQIRHDGCHMGDLSLEQKTRGG